MPDGSSSQTDPLIGQLLSGKFVPQKVMSRTPDFVTYQGINQKTQAVVRIHCPVTLRLSPEQVQKVAAAGPTLAQIGAIPGLVGAIDGGISGGIPFLVLPALPGPTLGDRLRLGLAATNPAGSRAIRSWLVKTAAALDSAHRLGFHHGLLTADSIVLLPDGSALIDGFPISYLLNTLGIAPRQPLRNDRSAENRAPELAGGKPVTPAVDQYALASIVTAALGRRPASADKARSADAAHRFGDCSAFARALLEDLESPAATAATGSAHEAPLEMAEPLPDDTLSRRPLSGPSSNSGFELELDEVESDTDLRSTRAKIDEAEEEDLSDLTFTKANQGLHAPKSTFDKATDLRGSRASWRRLSNDFKGLPIKQQTLAKVVIGAIALLVGLWLLRAGWRMVDFVIQEGRELAQGTVGKIQPDLGKLRGTGQEFADRMKGLWNEHVDVAGDAAEVSVIAPVVAPEQSGRNWPGRPQDSLSSDQFQEPSTLVEELIRHKGAYTQDGMGVFHIDNPQFPDMPQWIGGFGILRQPRKRSKPLLHGTLVHQADDGVTIVARYTKGKIKDFWASQGPAEDRTLVYAAMESKDDGPIADGAAFVLDSKDNACLAFAFSDGEVTGGQWCTKTRNEQKQLVYEPPKVIRSIEELSADEGRFAEYKSQLDRVLAMIPAMQTQAVEELEQYVRSNKLK